MRPWPLLVFALTLSCRTPTQITVKLRGVGLECKGGDAPAVVDTGIAAKERYAEIAAASVIGDRCEPAAGASNGEKDLGDVVLVPSGGGTNAEVLAVTAITLPSGVGASSEECLAMYIAEECGEGACDACIIARRSLGFVEHSKLEVRIEFEPRCAGVICDSTETCSNGKCISAATACPPTSDCGLVEEGGAGGSGAGGSGAGGSGSGAGGSGAGGSGAGGTGGTGGGAVTWTPLEGVLAAEDIVGTTVGQFKLYVAAGNTMHAFANNTTSNVYPATPNNPLAFMAVALSTDRAYAYGTAGAFQSTDNFSTAMLGVVQGAGVAGMRWDIAPRQGSTSSPHYLVAGLGGDTSADGSLNNPVGGALFTVLGAGFGGTAVGYNATQGPVLIFEAGQPSPVGDPAEVWDFSIWGYDVASSGFVFIASGGDTSRMSILNCGVGGCQPPDAFDISSNAQLPVDAIWGVPFNTTADVFVGGALAANASWVGRTTYNPTSGTFSPLETVPGPPGTDIHAIWVGPAFGGAEMVFVAGNGGVFSALVSDFPPP